MATRFEPTGSFQEDLAPLVDAALFKAAAKAATFAALRCPVWPGSQEGRTPTRDTIRAVPGEGMAFVTVGGAGAFIELGSASWSTDQTVHFVDEDGEDVFVGPGYEFPARAPRPFMRPALTDLMGWLAGGGE